MSDLCKLTRLSRKSGCGCTTPVSNAAFNLQNEEVIPNLVNSLQANDWKERQQAVEQFVDLVQLNPDGLGPKFTKVWLVTRLLDVTNGSLWPTGRVNLLPSSPLLGELLVCPVCVLIHCHFL